MFDHQRGISEDQQAALFIVNITNGRNLTEYANGLQVKDVMVLYNDMR